MNGAFVRPGLTRYPPPKPLLDFGIERLYWQANDPQVDQQFLDELRADPVRNLSEGVGIMEATNWYGSPSPEQFAAQIDQDLRRLASPSFYVNGVPPKQCAVLLDIESHDMLFVLACIVALRKLRSVRELLWTLEGHQGAIVKTNPDLVTKLNSDPNITAVVPQAYDANMVDWDEAAITRDLVVAGITPTKVVPALGLRSRTPRPWWEGVLFVEAWEQFL